MFFPHLRGEINESVLVKSSLMMTLFRFRHCKRHVIVGAWLSQCNRCLHKMLNLGESTKKSHYKPYQPNTPHSIMFKSACAYLFSLMVNKCLRTKKVIYFILDIYSLNLWPRFSKSKRTQNGQYTCPKTGQYICQ